jgi:hypothetical protein
LRGFILHLKKDNKSKKVMESSFDAGNTALSAEVFLGIPYASPPISSLRWMPPTTTSLHWKTTRVFNSQSPFCPQILPNNLNDKQKVLLSNQSEDCLYLNIYSRHRDYSGEHSFHGFQSRSLSFKSSVSVHFYPSLFSPSSIADWVSFC